MKNLKRISLALTMLFSVLIFGQETIDKEVVGEINKDTIKKVVMKNITICGPSRKDLQLIYIIDGILCESIDAIDPKDIKSIEVIKEPSSYKIYCGPDLPVVLITTKKAKLKSKSK